MIPTTFFSSVNSFHNKVGSWLLLLVFVAGFELPEASSQPTGTSYPEISGIYPHLAMFNNEGECGTGAVVPWADRLWVVTYAPHQPKGSSDKLYEITPSLEQIVRPESIGGTPANRMIHPESGQLFIGPYAIDRNRQVRVISYERMFGRPTGNARHLFEPNKKIYCATMEEGLYEIDVETLEVTELWTDEQRPAGRHSNLPGYHGKGLYSGQGVLIYANNGEHGKEALANPKTPSGVLASWDGKSEQWEIVRRNQFTEVTGPAGITGNSNLDDPIWSIGWDHRSLIVMCLDHGQWHSWRLPKGSHSYDGAHGWNTEWPRIRDIGEDSLLMTMHGLFWQFPKNFSASSSKGISPRSRYLKVVGDFCRWQDRIVLGTDDTAKSEFLNKRKAKGEIAAPQSQSNLWFLRPEQLDQLGPASGQGAVWLDEHVSAKTPSDPILATGFDRRSLHLSHRNDNAIKVFAELDTDGNGNWTAWKSFDLPARGNSWVDLSLSPPAVWIRLRTDQNVQGMTAHFAYSNVDTRSHKNNSMFDGIAKETSSDWSGGIVRARAENKRTLSFAAERFAGEDVRDIGYYELDGSLNLIRVEDKAAWDYQKRSAAIPKGILQFDNASCLYVDDKGNRWRLPFGSQLDSVSRNQMLEQAPMRIAREVATERDLFHAAGIFYELPAENAGGFAKVNPIATHNLRITDFCSYRGMLILSGVDRGYTGSNPHVIKSDDGLTALWVGAVDDLWSLGKPHGSGGPWKDSHVIAGVPSDPFLIAGFDEKKLSIKHSSETKTRFRIECDLTGDGHWVTHLEPTVEAGQTFQYAFPPGFAARWLRVTADKDCQASAQCLFQ
ncbi:MAG: hypothetical protein MUD03_17015 [Pirellula sp.]|nr:hypothetical protein [Pirellula sp.]